MSQHWPARLMQQPVLRFWTSLTVQVLSSRSWYQKPQRRIQTNAYTTRRWQKRFSPDILPLQRLLGFLEQDLHRNVLINPIRIPLSMPADFCSQPEVKLLILQWPLSSSPLFCEIWKLLFGNSSVNLDVWGACCGHSCQWILCYWQADSLSWIWSLVFTKNFVPCQTIAVQGSQLHGKNNTWHLKWICQKNNKLSLQLEAYLLMRLALQCLVCFECLTIKCGMLKTAEKLWGKSCCVTHFMPSPVPASMP